MAIDSGPSPDSAPVTKSDTVPQPIGRGIYVGTAGDVYVKHAGDSATIVYKAVPAGSILPIQATFIMAATTAADMVVMF